MTHSMMFAEDYLDFDRDEAEAEYRSALPSPEEVERIPQASIALTVITLWPSRDDTPEADAT